MTEHTNTTAELEGRVEALEQELEGLDARLAEAETKRDEYLDDLRRVPPSERVRLVVVAVPDRDAVLAARPQQVAADAPVPEAAVRN